MDINFIKKNKLKVLLEFAVTECCFTNFLEPEYKEVIIDGTN